MSSVQSKEAFLVFGLSGAGKSSTINRISRTNSCSVGHGSALETRNCELIHITASDSMFKGKYLLDMQGFHDTRLGESTEKLFERMQLYFLEGGVTQIHGVIFVISFTTDRTDLYEKFTASLGQLFTQDQIKRNAMVLLTNSDRLEAQDSVLHDTDKLLYRIEDDKVTIIASFSMTLGYPIHNYEVKIEIEADAIVKTKVQQWEKLSVHVKPKMKFVKYSCDNVLLISVNLCPLIFMFIITRVFVHSFCFYFLFVS